MPAKPHEGLRAAMPTWRLKTCEEVLFYHLCAACSQRSAGALLQAGWLKIRDNEPVACVECTRKCALTSQGLWGADDERRYAVCTNCSELPLCPLKGRYYC